MPENSARHRCKERFKYIFLYIDGPMVGNTKALW